MYYVQVSLLAYRLLGGSPNNPTLQPFAAAKYQPGNGANMFTYKGPRKVTVAGLWDEQVCLYICRRIYIYIYIHIYIYVYIYIYISVCVCIYVYAYIHVCVCMYIHVYLYMYIFLHMYKYIHMRVNPADLWDEQVRPYSASHLR